MRMIRKTAIAVLLSSLAVTGLGHGAHAAGMKTYANKAHGYTMQYPSNWTRKPHASGSDVEFDAPDHSAAVIDSATLGTATTAAIKAQQAKVLKGLGTPQGPLTYAVKSINGINYQISELVTKTNGKLLDVILLDTVHGAYLYDFEGFIAFNKPTTKAATATIDDMLNSLTLTK